MKDTEFDFYKKMGSYLQSLRTQKGFTQNEIAKRIGVTRQAICNYENGTRPMTAKLFVDYCKAIGADIADVIKHC